PHVFERQATTLQNCNGDLIGRPDFVGLYDLLGSEVSLGKHLEGIASILFRWQSNNARFKVSEAFESVKETESNEVMCARMLWASCVRFRHRQMSVAQLL